MKRAGLTYMFLFRHVEALDERSRRVLKMLADGAGTREIADEIGYSERTIKSVIQRIEAELGARNRVEAVALGIRSGLI